MLKKFFQLFQKSKNEAEAELDDEFEDDDELLEYLDDLMNR